jgi:hypothetical protein
VREGEAAYRLDKPISLSSVTSLLRRIQDEAVKPDADVGALLRQCKILAYRLHHKPLAEWVEHELAGYSNAPVPEYRKATTQSFGTFFGLFGARLNNAPIHSLGHLAEFNDFITLIEVRDGASALQELLRSTTKDLEIRWPQNVAVSLGHRVYENMQCMAAWWMLPRSAVLRILDNVRNMVLNFALEIELENPAAGEAAPKEVPVPSERVSQIFNQNFYGGNNQVAAGSKDFEQHMKVKPPDKGDRDALTAALRSCAVGEDDVAALDLVLEEYGDVGQIQTPRGLPTEVQPWIGRMLAKAADGSWNVGIGAAGEILATLLGAYFGLPS